MPTHDRARRCRRPLCCVQGAYSCLSLVKGVGLVAFRDPFGIRPLVLGRRKSPLGDEYCIASEDCAFGPIGFERMRDINPGEMVIVSQEGKLLSRQVRAMNLGGGRTGAAGVGCAQHLGLPALTGALTGVQNGSLPCSLVAVRAGRVPPPPNTAGRAQADAVHL